MQELFWIKSLFFFLHFGLCFLILLVLTSRKNRVSFLLGWPIGLLLALNGVGFIYFTPWLRELTSASNLLYHLSIPVMLIIGPLFVSRLRNVLGKQGLSHLHFSPAFLSLMLVLLDINLIYDALFVSQSLHPIGYLIYGLNLIKRVKSEANGNLTGLVFFMKVFTFSRMIHILEFTLWQLVGMIDEPVAWVFFTVAEVLMVLGTGNLLYCIATQKLAISEAVQLPSFVIERLESKLDPYLSRPDVFTDPLISLQKVANELKVSPHHISRYLNHRLGDSFINVINSQRIRKCENALKDPGSIQKSIQEIYFEAGFNSKSAFNTAFKNHTGCTPSEYRKKYTMIYSESI